MTNSPFHDPQSNPLPDANDIERETDSGIELSDLQDGSSPSSPSPHIKRDIKRLRNMIIGLLLAGLALGGVLGIGVVILLKRSGLTDPPEPNRGSLYERPNTIDRVLR